MNNYTELLKELSKTYVQLKPSPVSGIGVFAIRDIPKGCREMFTKDSGEWIKVPMDETDQLPNCIQQLIVTYCAYDDQNYYIEKNGFKKMDLSNFVNHSDAPNIVSINDGEFFEACVDIKLGEELLIDYSVLVEWE
jgi:SET domain-containing protein